MKIQKIKKAFAMALVALGAMLPLGNASATDNGWGPERATFEWEKPASYVTFNSITDNPRIGDERNFVRVKEAGTEDKYRDTVDLKIGKEYEVMVYFHNNASANLNESGKGLAENVRMTTIFPEKLTKNQSGVVKATISSPDANPQQVYDEAYLHADSTVYLRYVRDSAVIHSYGSVDGTILSEDLFNTDQGAYLGYSSNHWGVVPGCNEFAGYVTYRIKVDQPGFTLEKTVSNNKENEYAERLSVKPGSIADFKIVYKNTGTTDQTHVTVYDQMPEGMKYIAGTTFVKTNTNQDGEFVVDKLFDGGLVLGDFHSGEWAEITYKAEILDDENIFPCGTSKKIYNNSSVATENGTEYDKVEITVTRNCQAEERGCFNEDGTVKDIPECKCVNEDGTVKDTDECRESGLVTPNELPSTGPTEIVLTVVVLSGLWIAGAYWYGSHRELKKIQKNL